VGNLLRQ